MLNSANTLGSNAHTTSNLLSLRRYTWRRILLGTFLSSGYRRNLTNRPTASKGQEVFGGNNYIIVSCGNNYIIVSGGTKVGPWSLVGASLTESILKYWLGELVRTLVSCSLLPTIPDPIPQAPSPTPSLKPIPDPSPTV